MSHSQILQLVSFDLALITRPSPFRTEPIPFSTRSVLVTDESIPELENQDPREEAMTCKICKIDISTQVILKLMIKKDISKLTRGVRQQVQSFQILTIQKFHLCMNIYTYL